MLFTSSRVKWGKRIIPLGVLNYRYKKRDGEVLKLLLHSYTNVPFFPLLIFNVSNQDTLSLFRILYIAILFHVLSFHVFLVVPLHLISPVLSKRKKILLLHGFDFIHCCENGQLLVFCTFIQELSRSDDFAQTFSYKKYLRYNFVNLSVAYCENVYQLRVIRFVKYEIWQLNNRNFCSMKVFGNGSQKCPSTSL